MMVYKLALSASMNYIHDVFHILSLPKYINDNSYVLKIKEIQLLEDLSYKESLV